MKRCFFVPLAVIAALCVASIRTPAQTGNARRAQAEAEIKEAATKPTPRSADGHPDLTGYWTAPTLPVSAHLDDQGNFYLDGNPSRGGPLRDRNASLEEQLAHIPDPNMPPYKPELLAKVKELASDGPHNDPAFHCKPLGVPRIGAPRQIVQTPTLVVILYDTDMSSGDEPWVYRLVPTDGQPHRTDVDPSYLGDSVGHWEGDTLVVDVTRFNDDTWLSTGPGPAGAGSGYFHTEALHVVERYTRKGDTLRWEATAEDPNVLTKPWIVTPQTEILSKGMVAEEPPCEERETPHIVNKY